METPTPAERPVALVTGAAKRVGRAIALELHTAGANLVVHYREAAAAAQALVDDMNAKRVGSAISLQADLLDGEACSTLVENSTAHFGRLDALVNNASSFFATPLGSIDESDWLDLIGSNLKAANVAGFDVERTRFVVYVLAGALAGFAG